MTVKIGFQVISNSGEDEKYRANELNYHGPTVRGWRSSPNCTFPQEIILKLDVLAVLHQIQILVHQYLIPQKVEIYISSAFKFNESPETFTDPFEYLGFITFSDNKATQFRSRELKSVLIPSRKAKYVKLRIYKNHSNFKNTFNQVGLMAVNLLGNEIHCRSEKNELNNNECCFSNSFCQSKYTDSSNYISPYDDLAFEMFVDEETARLIKLIELKKCKAVSEEQFECASSLKVTLENLRAAGEIIGLYEQEKKKAIQMEDYDTAKLKKLQIDKFRQKVYSELRIDQIMDSSKLLQGNGSCCSEIKKKLCQNEKHTLRRFSLPYEHDNDNNQNRMSHSVNEKINIDCDNEDQQNSPHHKFTKQDTFSKQMIYSKSQSTLSHASERMSPTIGKKQFFSTSRSNPQLQHYESHERDSESSLQKETMTSLPVQFEHGSTSLSSNGSEVVVSSKFTSSDNYILPSECHESLCLMLTNTGVNNESSHDPLSLPNLNEFMPSTGWENEMGLKPNCKNKRSNVRSRSLTKNPSKSSFEAYEDRMLPALRSFHGNEIVRECQLAFDQHTKTALSERERKQAALPISIFGIEMIEKFYSKNFNDKEEGLKLLQRELKRIINLHEENDGTKVPSYNKVARAAIFLLHRALRDKVYSVYSMAAETVRLFFTEFIPQRVSMPEVARSVDKIFQELLLKSGDVTARIHNMAAHTLLTMADCEEVRRLHIISSQLSRPLTSSVHPRLALSRLEMVEQLILNHGISKDKKSGLTSRILAEFGSSGLHHPAEAVRKVSERILIHVYKVNPKIVRKQLPPDDNVTRRNLLYRQLFEEFDHIDMEKKKEEENIKDKATTKTCAENCDNPDELSFKQKEFCTTNTPGGIKNNSINSDWQLNNIKNFLSLNLIPKNKIGGLRELSEIPLTKPSVKTVQKVSNIQSLVEHNSNFGKKTSTTIFNQKKRQMTENSKFTSNNLRNNINTEPAPHDVKFPLLADSIDTAKARMVFAQKKNLAHNNSENLTAKPKSEQFYINKNEKINLYSSERKERQRNISTSSFIPVPTYGSKRKHLTDLPTKSVRNKNEIRSSFFDRGKNGINNIKMSNKKTENNCRTENTLQDTKVNATKNIKRKLKNLTGNADVFEEKFALQLLKNIKNGNPLEQSGRFSESMLASIKENEFSLTPANNGLEHGQETLKTCIFCLSSKKWLNEDNLNQHYLNECPMLTTCEYCMEIIEISEFTNHLIDECSQKYLFKKCSKCNQAILGDLYNNHECSEASKSHKTRCPFCHLDIGSGEKCWRKHFMGKNICKNHPRHIQ